MAKVLSTPEQSSLFFSLAREHIGKREFWAGELAHYEVFGQMLGDDRPSMETRPELDLRPVSMKNAGFILDHKAHEILHPSPKSTESTESTEGRRDDPTLPFVINQSAMVEHSF